MIARFVAFCSVVLLVAALLVPTDALAQAVHLAPPHKVTIDADAPLLSFQALDPSYEGTTLSIQDGRVILRVPGKPSEVIPIEDRSIREIEEAIRSRHPGMLDVRSTHSFRSASFLQELDTPLSISGSALSVVEPRDNLPEVFVGFGLLLSLGPPASNESQSSLLNQGGFQLDVGGFHRLIDYQSRADKKKNSEPGWLSRRISTPALYFTGRTSLSADQEQLVNKGESSLTGAGSASPVGQFDAALQNADEVSLNIQMDAVWELGSPQQELAFYAGGGYGYTRLGSYEFPSFDVNGTDVPAEQVFTANAISSVTERFQSTFPLGEYGYGLMLRFIRNDDIAFYLGVGFHSREVARRDLSFTRDENGAPNPSSLTGRIRADDQGFYRGLLGAQIAGIADVRIDAMLPVNRNLESVLRIVLARSLDVSRGSR